MVDTMMRISRSFSADMKRKVKTIEFFIYLPMETLTFTMLVKSRFWLFYLWKNSVDFIIIIVLWATMNTSKHCVVTTIVFINCICMRGFRKSWQTFECRIYYASRLQAREWQSVFIVTRRANWVFFTILITPFFLDTVLQTNLLPSTRKVLTS